MTKRSSSAASAPRCSSHDPTTSSTPVLTACPNPRRSTVRTVASGTPSGSTFECTSKRRTTCLSSRSRAGMGSSWVRICSAPSATRCLRRRKATSCTCRTIWTKCRRSLRTRAYLKSRPCLWQTIPRTYPSSNR
uniref:(northern house mosquito) hypothetical protein n=1 Tax=Culex pipiens TaxID=7175 RepID=A0A8D8D4Y9_CULPI